MTPSSSASGAGDASPGGVLPEIARRAVASAVAGRAEEPPRFATGYLCTPRPVFVTLRRRDGELRGCIGTLVSKYGDVVTETWRMAREAAFHDPRFPPMNASELDGVRFEVSVLHPLEDVADPAVLDPRRYGVVVSTADGRRGALLPAIEGIDTVSQQLALTRRKGGIGPTEPVRIQRFEVDHFGE